MNFRRRFTLFALSTIFLLPSGCVAAFGQTCDTAKFSQLEEENAKLKITNSTLKMQMLNQSAQPIVEERQQSIHKLEELHPGMVWDDHTGTMVAKSVSAPRPSAPNPPTQKPASTPDIK